MPDANVRRLYNIAAAVVLAYVAGLWLENLWAAQRNVLGFDDAYMFARYADNLRHGHGFSWNPDGVHTYGPTSLLWTFMVTALSVLPLKSWTMLTTASWLCSVSAAVAMAWAVERNAQSSWMKSAWRVLPLVVLPLTGTAAFFGNQATGMETMLAMLLVAVFAGLTLRWSESPAGSVPIGLCGVLLFLARPEAGVVVVILPLLVFALRPEGKRLPVRSLATALGVFAAGVAGELLICRAYFGTALPLSFYIKGHDAYKGYAEVWFPEIQLLAFLACCQLFLIAMLLLARRRDARLLLCCLLPLLMIVGYLQTVTQIMGFNARYYVPYLPLVVVPALLVLDRRMALAEWPERIQPWRLAGAAALMLVLLATKSESVLSHLRALEHRVHTEYEQARIVTGSSAQLPIQDWAEAMRTITDDLVAQLPEGATVASTEVGYLGAQAPQVNVIDLAGLNDTEIARHGFEAQALLDRKPDLIWLPNMSYTWQRGVLLSDPRMLKEYDVYGGAARFGIAVRKDSPFHDQTEKALNAYWHAVFPGTTPAQNHAVGIDWSGKAIQLPSR